MNKAELQRELTIKIYNTKKELNAISHQLEDTTTMFQKDVDILTAKKNRLQEEFISLIGQKDELPE